jgi:phage tail-like protein
MPITRNARSYGVGKYGLDIDGLNAGWIKEVEGGNATADVVTEKMGTDHLARKHLANVRYEEISFKCGTGMTKAIYEWIKTGFNQTSNAMGRKNGAIIYADYDAVEIARLTFQHGMLSEYTMPALDAGSKDAALMTIKIQPEITRKTMAPGSKLVFQGDSAKQKMWLPSNFRLRIDGCEQACMRVNKIDALTVKQKVVEDAVGERRDYERVAVAVEVPNLVVTLSEADADPFYKWHEDFVIKGLCGQDKEKGGTLEYLAPDTSTVLFTLNFRHLGIFKISTDKGEAGNEGIRRVKVEMYCEDIEFGYQGAATYQ